MLLQKSALHCLAANPAYGQDDINGQLFRQMRRKAGILVHAQAQAQAGGRVEDSAKALEQTKALADTLAADKDGKFANSKFLQFISKMSRGEIILDGNEVSSGRLSQAQYPFIGWLMVEFPQSRGGMQRSWAGASVVLTMSTPAEPSMKLKSVLPGKGGPSAGGRMGSGV